MSGPVNPGYGGTSVPDAPIEVTVDNTAAVSGNVAITNLPAVQPINDNGGSITVDGAVTASGTVTANQGTAGAAAWKVDGSAVTQPVSGPLTDAQLRASEVPVSADLAHSSRADTYTAAVDGTTVDLTGNPLSTFSVQVKGTGAVATTWDIRLEGSLDGTNFVQIVQHTNVSGDGAIVVSTARTPVNYMRSRCASVVLGGATNIVATILGVQ